MGSKCKVSVSRDRFPLRGMDAMAYYRIHFCIRLRRQRNSEFNEVEGEGILSYEVKISCGRLPRQY